MKLLFLSHRVPHPPDRGDRISTHHLLRHFAEQGARIRVGCLAEDERDLAAVAEVAARADEVCCPSIRRRLRRVSSLRGLATGDPLTIPYFHHRALQTRVDAWMREDAPDVVFAYSSSMASYVMHHPGPLRVMHFAELDSDKWRQYAAVRRGLGRWIYGRESRLLLRFETAVARTFDASLVVSEVEKELFERLIPGVTPRVVPNGVDVEHFTSRGGGRREPHTVIFTGVMDYEPNVDGVLWFYREAWPSVRAELPGARFLVVGNRPCAEIRRLHGRDGVEVTGWVAETPPYFDRASVAIAPLRLGRGLQNKVLEAMSMGLPVVATAQAMQGLGAVTPDAAVVAQDGRAIADAVLGLMRDPARAQAIGRRAAEFVRARFRWENAFGIVDGVLEELRAARAARST